MTALLGIAVQQSYKVLDLCVGRFKICHKDHPFSIVFFGRFLVRLTASACAAVVGTEGLHADFSIVLTFSFGFQQCLGINIDMTLSACHQLVYHLDKFVYLAVIIK